METMFESHDLLRMIAVDHDHDQVLVDRGDTVPPRSHVFDFEAGNTESFASAMTDALRALTAI